MLKIFMKQLIVALSMALLAHSAQAVSLKDWMINIRNDRLSTVKENIAEGAPLNDWLPDGQVPLTEAIANQSWESYDYLVSQPKIEVNQTNRYTETPLMYLAIVGDLNRAKILIEKGASVNKFGWTALHYAIIKSHADMVKLLLAKGAWVDAVTPDDGSTPLLLAVRQGCYLCAQYLVQKGANPRAENTKGESAMSLAQKSSSSRYLKLFSQSH